MGPVVLLVACWLFVPGETLSLPMRECVWGASRSPRDVAIARDPRFLWSNALEVCEVFCNRGFISRSICDQCCGRAVPWSAPPPMPMPRHMPMVYRRTSPHLQVELAQPQELASPAMGPVQSYAPCLHPFAFPCGPFQPFVAPAEGPTRLLEIPPADESPAETQTRATPYEESTEALEIPAEVQDLGQPEEIASPDAESTESPDEKVEPEEATPAAEEPEQIEDPASPVDVSPDDKAVEPEEATPAAEEPEQIEDPASPNNSPEEKAVESEEAASEEPEQLPELASPTAPSQVAA